MIRLTKSHANDGVDNRGGGRNRDSSPGGIPHRERSRRLIEHLAAPARAVGGFFEMTLDTFVKMWRRPFQLREFLEQTWMIARVSLVPTLLVSIPFTVLVAFTLNILLREIGAADLSGAGTAFGTVTQLGPVVTVLVVAGAGATAICADLGARTIREEIDAMRVLGIDPIQRLVVPRVLASTFVALLLNGLVCAIGLLGGYVFSVFLQGVNPGAFINGLTVLTGLPELLLAEVKALLFGVVAGLVGCYRGLTVKGGAKGVGIAVNETVVYAFICLFVINVIMTAVGVRVLAK
jgi:phospholipid/cholesterol/gamma-HCH transport system permease protein